MSRERLTDAQKARNALAYSGVNSLELWQLKRLENAMRTLIYRIRKDERKKLMGIPIPSRPIPSQCLRCPHNNQCD